MPGVRPDPLADSGFWQLIGADEFATPGKIPRRSHPRVLAEESEPPAR
jgi:hypothetical protein